MSMADDLHRRARQCLNSYPCRCQYGPWTKDSNTGQTDRPLISRCSRCILIEDLDIALDPVVTP